MAENVRLTHTAFGAVTVVNIGAFQLSKSYPTMRAAASEARQLCLITLRQQLLLEGNAMVCPVALTAVAERIDGDSLFNSGFMLI
jgi:hypothetical protein